MHHDTRPLWQRYTLPPLTDEILPTLEETMFAIMTDQIDEMMDCQKLIAQFPISDISARIVLAKMIQFQRDIKAGKFDRSQFKPLVEAGKAARFAAFEEMVGKYPDRMISFYGMAALALIFSDNEQVEPEIKLVS